MHLNVDPGFDADLEVAQRALERGWVTREGIESAILQQERTPGSRLVNLLPLTPDQLQRLIAPEGPMPPEIAKVAQEPSRRLDHYILGDFLHSGGMGRVYKAWDLKLSRWVALKCLKAVGDERSEAYFDREARLAAGLSHPNIAAIYASGRSGGESFIAMQLIPGKTLDQWGRRDVPRLATWIRDAARAVAYANSKGIVHRDLKPTNVMVTPEGQVYVLDFGLARPVAIDRSHSATGKAMGTPAYMSPEQARGEAVDARSDVYSLGATLFECLTGRAPFSGTTIYDVLRKVEDAAPARPRRLNPRIPPDLETIILKCLEKEAARRYRSADELADDLDRYLNHDPIQARPASFMYRIQRCLAKRKAITLASIASVVLAGVLGWWFLVGRPQSEQLTIHSENLGLRESAMKLWAEARGLAMAGVDPEGIRRRAKDAREAFERAIEVKEDASSLVMKARCLQLECRHEDALKALERAYKLDSQHAEARLELAKHLLFNYQISRGLPPSWSTSTGSRNEIRYHVGSLPSETAEEARWRQRAEKLLTPGTFAPAQERLLEGLLAMGQEDHGKAMQALAVYTRSEPWDTYALNLEGMCGYFSRQFEAGIATFDRLLVRVSDVNGLYWRAFIKEAMGQHARAFEDFTKVIDLRPKFAAAYCGRGLAELHLHHFDKAIEDFSKALQMSPGMAMVLPNRASAKMAKGLYDEAIADCTKALELDPNCPGAHINRGIAQKYAGRHAEAIADLSKAVELRPKDALGYIHRGILQGDRGDLDGAISDFRKAGECEPENALILNNLASAKHRKGLHAEAIADCTKAIALDPGYGDAYTTRGGALRDSGRIDEAIADWTKAVELNPMDATAYVSRGVVQARQGKLEEAIADMTKGINIDPKYALAYMNRGIAKAQKGSWEEADKDLTKAIELDPMYFDAYANRGLVMEELKLHDRAISDYEKALEMAPPDWRKRASIRDRRNALAATRDFLEAKKFFDQKKYPEAVDKFKRVAEGNSKQAAPSAYNVACGYSLLGDKSKALEWLEKAIEMGWKDVAQMEKDPDLESLREEAKYKQLLNRLKDQ